MRTYIRSLFLLALMVCVGATLVAAAPFDPVFRVTGVIGDVSVKLPESNSFVPAEEGKAYPYGTSIQSGGGGSVLVNYSEGNTAQVGSGTSLMIESDTILINEGKVDVTLEDDKDLNVVSSCSSAMTTGGNFGAEVRREAELSISVYTCNSGNLSISSDMFTCPQLEPNDYVSVSCAYDNSFVRVKNIKGEFDLSFTDDTGTPRVSTLEKDSVVKIWRKQAAKSKAVAYTVLLINPDGSISDTINFVTMPPSGDDDDDAMTSGTTDADGKDRARPSRTDSQEPTDGDDDEPDLFHRRRWFPMSSHRRRRRDDDYGDPTAGDGAGDDDDDDGTYPQPDDITPKGLR